jgi:hypothetical protein
MAVIDYPAEDAGRDVVLEWAARRIEAGSFSDLRGVAAKRKRDREAAQMRIETAKEVRAEAAALLRAFISRSDLDVRSILAEIAGLDPDKRHDRLLTGAWPLAWKGLVDIECRVLCNSNQMPPPVNYRITLTERGRAMIEKAEDERK